MNFLKFTDFRNHTKEYFDKVESGNTYVIIRKGKPIAKIVPFNENITGWKRDTRKIQLKSGKDSLEYILKERNEK